MCLSLSLYIYIYICIYTPTYTYTYTYMKRTLCVICRGQCAHYGDQTEHPRPPPSDICRIPARRARARNLGGAGNNNQQT